MSDKENDVRYHPSYGMIRVTRWVYDLGDSGCGYRSHCIWKLRWFAA